MGSELQMTHGSMPYRLRWKTESADWHERRAMSTIFIAFCPSTIDFGNVNRILYVADVGRNATSIALAQYKYIITILIPIANRKIEFSQVPMPFERKLYCLFCVVFSLCYQNKSTNTKHIYFQFYQWMCVFDLPMNAFQMKRKWPRNQFNGSKFTSRRSTNAKKMFNQHLIHWVGVWTNGEVCETSISDSGNSLKLLFVKQRGSIDDGSKVMLHL